MIAADELLERLDRAVRAAGCDVELSAQAARQGATRFAGSRVTQTSDVEDVVVQARVALGRRVGAARENALDEAALARLIAAARQAAAAQPEGPWNGFAGDAPLAPGAQASFDEETAAATAESRARLVAPAFIAARSAGLEAAGLCAVSSSAFAVATSAGCRRSARTTWAKLEVIATGGEASARLGRAGASISPLAVDAAPLAVQVCERALSTRQPLALDPGTYDVVLEPPCVAELLEWMALTSFGARSLEDGTSCLAGPGERITGAVSIYDDALGGEEGGARLPFDAEGTPKQRLMLVDGGKAGLPAHDRATAAAMSAESTGHASPVGDELFDGGPLPQHLHMAGGSDTREALIARLGRGLLVARFHYVNGLLDPRRGLMTGMTRDGVWMVEDGRVTRPVRNLRWTQSVLEAFERLDGVTRAREVVPASLSETAMVVPAVLARGWSFRG